MADITQTPANVVDQAGAQLDNTGRYGATVVAGQPVYRDATDNKWKLADNNVSAVLANVGGISLNGGSDGQPASVLIAGDINLGATLILGETYILSSNVGKIAPVADISTNFVTILGVAITTAILRFKPIVAGIQHA
jgi:hypothetical protein